MLDVGFEGNINVFKHMKYMEKFEFFSLYLKVTEIFRNLKLS